MQAPDTAPGSLILASVYVAGHPKTKGSMTPLGNGKMVDKPDSLAWRVLVAERLKTDRAIREITAGCGHEPVQGRVGVQVISYLQPPGFRGDVDPWWKRAMAWIISKLSGDVDKLLRNVLDALSACDESCGARCKKHSGVIWDDSQVWDLYGHKRIAAPGVVPGQQITVWLIPEDASW